MTYITVYNLSFNINCHILASGHRAKLILTTRLSKFEPSFNLGTLVTLSTSNVGSNSLVNY